MSGRQGQSRMQTVGNERLPGCLGLRTMTGIDRDKCTRHCFRKSFIVDSYFMIQKGTQAQIT